MSANACPDGLPRHPSTSVPGELVVARAWKYNGAPHWVVPGYLLGSDEHGYWIHQPEGSLVSRPGRAHLADCAALCLVPREGSWLGTFYASDAVDMDLYLDVSTRIGWQPLPAGGWEVNSIDMDLDVIRSGSRGLYLDDEDEFIDHARQMRYPQELQSSMRTAADELLARVHTNEPPFNQDFRRQWLDRASKLSTQR